MSSGGLINISLHKSGNEWVLLPHTGKLTALSKFVSHHFAQANWGGSGTVTGTVRIGATLVKRKVRLYDVKSGILIREQWSDANGNYSFPGLRKDLFYTVTATDYNGIYNDVIAANITAA